MNQKMIILGLSGMTECGKSTAGMHFDSVGVRRVKMVRILERVWREHGQIFPDAEPFVNHMLTHDPQWLRMAFADMLLKDMAEGGYTACSLESMGDPEMVNYLHDRFPGEFFSVYIAATLEKRLEHQMIRKGLVDVEAAKAILLPKDEFKTNFWHMEEIEPKADFVVENYGTLEQFITQLDRILQIVGVILGPKSGSRSPFCP